MRETGHRQIHLKLFRQWMGQYVVIPTTDDVKMGRPHCLVNKHWLHNKNRHKDAHRTLLEFGFAKTIYHESNSKLGAIFKAKAARSRAKCTRNASKSELQNFQAQFKNPLRNQTLMTFTKV